MRPFFESFLEGFTGAGMFLGPRPSRRIPLCDEDEELDEAETYSALKQMIASTEVQNRPAVLSTIYKILREAGMGTVPDDALAQDRRVQRGSSN